VVGRRVAWLLAAIEVEQRVAVVSGGRYGGLAGGLEGLAAVGSTMWVRSCGSRWRRQGKAYCWPVRL
jgi:hypothetical protein